MYTPVHVLLDCDHTIPRRGREAMNVLHHHASCMKALGCVGGFAWDKPPWDAQNTSTTSGRCLSIGLRSVVWPEGDVDPAMPLAAFRYRGAGDRLRLIAPFCGNACGRPAEPLDDQDPVWSPWPRLVDAPEDAPEHRRHRPLPSDRETIRSRSGSYDTRSGCLGGAG